MFRKTQPSRTSRKCITAAAASLIEQLEMRLLFSTYTITTLGDSAGVVTPAGEGRFNATTLRAAITAANAHTGADTINFAVTGKIDLATALPEVSDGLTIAGPAASKLTVERSTKATTDFSVLHVGLVNPAVVSGITIANGSGERIGAFAFGGGIFNEGALTLQSCTLTNNSALIGSVAAGNTGNGYGGGIFSTGTLAVADCTLSNNTAGMNGGGIENESRLTATHSTLAGNTAFNGEGGGIESTGVSTLLSNCALSGNKASTTSTNSGGVGGGVANTRGVLTLAYCSLSGNSAVNGGAIENAGTLSLANCTLSGNSTQVLYDNNYGDPPYGGSGAGIESSGSTTLANCTLSRNTANGGNGGGINSQGTLTLVNSIITGNVANPSYAQDFTGSPYDGSGGGINCGGRTTVTNCTLSRNSAANGGAIESGGALALANCTVTGNSAPGAYYSGGSPSGHSWFGVAGGDGGGIDSAGATTLTNCAFAANTAVNGGGIENESRGPLSLINCTLSGNLAQSASRGSSYQYYSNSYSIGGFGGGIDSGGQTTLANCTLSGNVADAGGGGIESFGALGLANCTLSGNSAQMGGGIDISSNGTSTLANSIIVGNRRTGSTPVPDDVFLDTSYNGAPVIDPASAYDLIGTDSSKTLLNGKNHNRIGVTPAQVKLGPLANNGGPTQTMALRPGSIAIDAGSNALAVGPDGKPLTIDQRGLPRVSGVAVDIGAFELQVAPKITGFGLLDAVTGKSLGTLTDGMTISLSKLGTKHLDVQALASAWAGSVTFSLNGKYVGIDSLPVPFTLLRAESQTPFGGLAPGDYTLIVQAFSLKYARGVAGAFATIHFKVAA